MDDLPSHNPLAWAQRCRSRAMTEVNAEARAALIQMAEEFEFIATEIEGLVSGFEALVKRPTPPVETG